MPRNHIIIRGDVQGVGFRFFTLREAQRWGVAGWVRNCMDGTVEIEAQGEATTLERFVAAVSQGPSYSSVDRAEVKRIEEIPSERDFRIRM